VARQDVVPRRAVVEGPSRSEDPATEEAEGGRAEGRRTQAPGVAGARVTGSFRAREHRGSPEVGEGFHVRLDRLGRPVNADVIPEGCLDVEARGGLGTRGSSMLRRGRNPAGNVAAWPRAHRPPCSPRWTEREGHSCQTYTAKPTQRDLHAVGAPQLMMHDPPGLPADGSALFPRGVGLPAKGRVKAVARPVQHPSTNSVLGYRRRGRERDGLPGASRASMGHRPPVPVQWKRREP